MHIAPFRLFAIGALIWSSAAAKPLTIILPAIPANTSEPIRLGSARRPDGTTLTADARNLRLDGRPWTPVMGEFHYARYPAEEWREELLKLKAGGIDIVATYVFWIHHEEVEGRWDWTGRRNLRQFVETARDAGLTVIVRAGPWCHGEVRHGGLPDWIVARGNTRTEDPVFLASTTEFYRQIAAQLQGLLWKDGGPVIGVQLDNEYRGPASYLLRLKQIARAAGLDTPLYTRTSWPDLQTPMPYGEILPLHSVYPEGFWDRELTAMPGRYWAGFHFSTMRTYANIADQALGKRDVKDAPDVGRYPYLTCEIGGGMMSSYHRRILVDPRDIEVTTLVKLGSGSMSPGYYMYHGGVNPEGHTTLMEEQATLHTNLNDLPVKNYDFQAPLGQYGQVRPHYHLLRRLHLFMHAFGSEVTGMDTVLPDLRPAGQDDTTTLRWAARSDGRRGFIFVNNYERGRPLPPKASVQFALNASESGPLTFPHEPVTIPADASFIWPFNLDLGNSVTLVWSTAQPLTRIIDGDKNCTVIFAAIPGVPAEFAFRGARVIARHGRTETGNDGLTRVLDLQPGRGVAITANSRVRIVLLSEPDSLALWQGTWHGRERVFLTPAGLVIDGDTLRLSSLEPGPLSVSVFPALNREDDGIFQRLTSAPTQALVQTAVRLTPVQTAGPLRVIALGAAPSSVAVAPVDADFEHAALWRIELPAGLDLTSDPILRLNYTGDVARVMIGGKFVMDDFYNGLPLEIGLRRHAADLRQGGLTVAILPLQKTAPIYLSSPAARPDFGARDGIAELHGAELIPAHTAEFSGRREMK